jgi:hypothetical protein
MDIPYKSRISKQIPYQWKMLKRCLFKRSEGEEILRLAYLELQGKNLDLGNAQTFTEKLFRRMILVNRHGNPVFTRLADKYLVRDYIRHKIGEKYLVNLIWHGKDPSEIPFIKLPARFVIKANHGSGKNIVVNGAFDQVQIIKQLSGWLQNNYYWTAREYHYYKIRPQILIEEFLDDGEPQGPLDYRFWCFNGRPELIQIDNHSHNINPFYNSEWKRLALQYRENDECEITKPDNLQEMLLIASKLSADFDFVRIDLYKIKGQIYFGEFTFTPVAGKLRFKPESWDLMLGQKWTVN